jgi:hypothetical protein
VKARALGMTAEKMEPKKVEGSWEKKEGAGERV